MHLLKHSKTEKAKPLIPIVSQWKIPGVRKMRGRRFRDGVDIGPCGPPKPVPDVAAIKAVKEAYAAAALMPRPQEGGGFDLNKFTPMPGRVLVARGPMIKEENGIVLPESQWRTEKWYYVLRVADDVTSCAVGDRVVMQSKHKPKAVDLGGTRFFMTRESVIVAIVEPVAADA